MGGDMTDKAFSSVAGEISRDIDSEDANNQPQYRKVRQQLLSPSPSPRNTSPTPDDSQTILESMNESHELNGRAIEAVKTAASEASNETSEGLEVQLEAAGRPIKLVLSDIPEESVGVTTISPGRSADEGPQKLSSEEIQELTSQPESLPLIVSAAPTSTHITIETVELADSPRPEIQDERADLLLSSSKRAVTDATADQASQSHRRPGQQRSRTSSSPVMNRHESQWTSATRQASPLRRSVRPSTIIAHRAESAATQHVAADAVEAMPTIPLPPSSLPVYLQLELASTRPSPLYVYRPTSSEYPYESSQVKFERLVNFLLLPPQLEQVLWFGSLACLDAWLSTFTILPIRFARASSVLISWWLEALAKEVRYISGFIYHGSGRIWHRRIGRGRRLSVDSAPTSRSSSRASRPALSTHPSLAIPARIPDSTTSSHNTLDGVAERLLRNPKPKSKSAWGRRHHRTKSVPSRLNSYHKTDLLHGLLILTSSLILVQFDASRMYHSIRGQNAMKLYVLYNLLEVVDKLLAALGQDILECLTADETISRGADGRSRILRPFGMFILALIYNVMHTVILFYQVITLNVAVNAYSNALLALLMSNQFVEIKSAVFKKFEKENLFQMSCADVVERFQLWLMLVIIGLRNVVEVGGLVLTAAEAEMAETIQNPSTSPKGNLVLPNSFTILPGFTGEVLSPFLIVLGSEMLVDWIKHAYISKFNGIKPAVYQKYLDVLAKDYYTNAFVNQNLLKRLGLPVIPLSCLFIRAMIQTYHMFVANHLPIPMASSATALSVEADVEAAVPIVVTAFGRFKNIVSMAFGGRSMDAFSGIIPQAWYHVGTDRLVALATFCLFFLVIYLVALICKLVLGIVLLRFARYRYQSMSERESVHTDTKGKRFGGWGVVELDDEKKKRIYEEDPAGLKNLKEKERKIAEKEKLEKKDPDFEKVSRYQMAAKRIW